MWKRAGLFVSLAVGGWAAASADTPISCIPIGTCQQQPAGLVLIDCTGLADKTPARAYCDSARCLQEKARLISGLIDLEQQVATGGLNVEWVTYGDHVLNGPKDTCNGTATVRSACTPKAGKAEVTKFRCTIANLKPPCAPDPSPDVRKKTIRVYFSCGQRRTSIVLPRNDQELEERIKLLKLLQSVEIEADGQLDIACPIGFPGDWKGRLQLNDCLPKAQEKVDAPKSEPVKEAPSPPPAKGKGGRG